MGRILITGGTGFVGSHLVEALIGDSDNQIYVTTYNSNHNGVDQLINPERIIQVDLTNQAQTFELFKKIQPDQIYHLASMAVVGKSFDNTRRVIETNTTIQLNILEAIRQITPEARAIMVGSAMCYDLAGHYPGFSPEAVDETYPLGPISPYAVSKTTQDLLTHSYAQSYQLSLIRVRPFNHIGERQSPDFAVSSFAQQIAKIEHDQQDILRVGNLTTVRDLTDVKDMVSAYLLLMDKGQVGEVYNIGTGKGHQMQKVLNTMIELAQAEIILETDATRIRPADIKVAIANPAKINALGFKPQIELKETLQRILNYWRQQP